MSAMTLFVVMSVLPALITGHSNGVPAIDDVCRRMVPGHYGTVAQPEDSAPFDIILEHNCYSPTQSIKVTILSKMSLCVPFKGLLLQVRSSGSNSGNHGEWHTLDTDGYKLLECFNNENSVVSHSSKDSHIEATFQWTAPEEDVGELQVLGTILKSKTVYWVQVKSSTLVYNEDCVSVSRPLNLPNIKCGQSKINQREEEDILVDEDPADSDADHDGVEVNDDQQSLDVDDQSIEGNQPQDDYQSINSAQSQNEEGSDEETDEDNGENEEHTNQDTHNITSNEEDQQENQKESEQDEISDGIINQTWDKEEHSNSSIIINDEGGAKFSVDNGVSSHTGRSIDVLTTGVSIVIYKTVLQMLFF